ncbi:MAG: phasin family protein [Thermodesulfobacteriota bacterium]
MFDLIKKTLLTGVGLGVMTKDKVEELARKGELSEKEGKELIDDLLKKSEQAREDLEAKIEGLVRKALEKLNVGAKKDITQLNAKIECLEKRRVG